MLTTSSYRKCKLKNHDYYAVQFDPEGYHSKQLPAGVKAYILNHKVIDWCCKGCRFTITDMLSGEEVDVVSGDIIVMSTVDGVANRTKYNETDFLKQFEFI